MLIILLWFSFIFLNTHFLLFIFIIYFLLCNDQVISLCPSIGISWFYESVKKMLKALRFMGFIPGSSLRDHSAQLFHFIEWGADSLRLRWHLWVIQLIGAELRLELDGPWPVGCSPAWCCVPVSSFHTRVPLGCIFIDLYNRFIHMKTNLHVVISVGQE